MNNAGEDIQPLRVLVLEDEGAVPITANTPARALDAIEAAAPDVAILDVNLGRGLTCESVAERLSALAIPFLIHSGDLMRQGELIARIGAEVIAKPAASSAVARRAVAIAREQMEAAE